MADVHQIKFYPVGNGDTTQIITAKGKRILFDFCHRANAEDEDNPAIDLKAQSIPMNPRYFEDSAIRAHRAHTWVRAVRLKANSI